MTVPDDYSVEVPQPGLWQQELWQQAFGTTSTDTASWQQQQQAWVGQYYKDYKYQPWPPDKPVATQAVRFMRINDKAGMNEGAEYPEPLDALRLKVKRWLKIPEMEYGL